MTNNRRDSRQIVLNRSPVYFYQCHRYKLCQFVTWADLEGGQGFQIPLENHKWLKVSSIASRGRSIRRSLNMLMIKKRCQDPPCQDINNSYSRL